MLQKCEKIQKEVYLEEHKTTHSTSRNGSDEDFSFSVIIDCDHAEECGIQLPVQVNCDLIKKLNKNRSA